ncbi:MAG: MFS transporter [Crocinitomicaceae bacterium]
MEKGNKKIIRGWVMYDWANSVYNLVISSAIFPIFYDNITTNQFIDKKFGGSQELYDQAVKLDPDLSVTVNFFGTELSNSVLMSFVLSASFLVVTILSPMLSGIADFSGSKKRFMQFFCYLGALSCMTLYWFNTDSLELGMLSIFLASIGFWNSLVFYNAYLPEIAEPKDHDKISARGFSLGYFGAMILLILCLVWIQVFDGDVKWCFVGVGVWWLAFSQITYRVLPNNVYKRKKESGIIWKGFKELRTVFKEFKGIKSLKRFLLSFFFFNTGVQTVMLMATLFAKKEIIWPINEATGKPDDSGLIIAILLIQILGAVGAFTMSRLSRVMGNIKTLGLSVSIWILICGAAYVVTTPVQFYLLACGVGLVMGGVQALSRSTYSKMLPQTKDHASYFSFYDSTEKIGIVVGTLSFGLFEAIFGSIRYSVIAVAIFFIIGFFLLFLIPKMKSENEDEEVKPA